MSVDSEKVVSFRVEKAEVDLATANSLYENGFYGASMNRLYYAAFHVVSAILFKHGIKHKAHNGAKAMFELHFIKSAILPVSWGKFYANLFNQRNESDYEDFAVFTADDILPLLPQTAEFISLIKGLIQEDNATNSLHPRQ